MQALPEKLCVGGPAGRCVQQARDPGNVVIGEQLRRVLVQESRGGENRELIATIELEDVADAVENLAADAPATGFEPAECAVVDVGEPGNFLLRESAVA